MSIGVIAGSRLAYPVNVWMVAMKMKHGLMTERPDGGSVHGPGHAMAHGGHGGTAHSGPHGHATASEVTTPQLAAMAAFRPGIADRDGDAGEFRQPAAERARRGRDHHAARHDHEPIRRGRHARHVRGSSALPDRRYGSIAAAIRNWRRASKAASRSSISRRPSSAAEYFRTHVDAFAFNGQVPGPRLRFRQGDRVRINVVNRLPDTTTVHWHGLILPNVMDGAAEVTQQPIPNGQLYRYEFTAVQSGTYFYHSHDHVDRQQALGLYGAMIIDPRSRGRRAGRPRNTRCCRNGCCGKD
jgi:hypothetical protein